MVKVGRRRVMAAIVVSCAVQLLGLAAGPRSPLAPTAASAATFINQTATKSACANSFTFTFPRPTSPGTLLVLVSAINSGNGNGVSSPGWNFVTGTYGPGYLFNVETWMYFSNPGGLTSVTVTQSDGNCEALTFVEFSASAATGAPDTAGNVVNSYGVPTSSLSGSTGTMQQAGELVIWGTGQGANPEAYSPGTAMTMADNDGAANGTGVSSEIEYAIAPTTGSFTASSSWTAAAAAVGTIVSVPVTLLNSAPTSYPSDLCTAGTTAIDGWVGGVYVRLRAQQPNTQTEWVCLRVDAGLGASFGG